MEPTALRGHAQPLGQRGQSVPMGILATGSWQLDLSCFPTPGLLCVHAVPAQPRGPGEGLPVPYLPARSYFPSSSGRGSASRFWAHGRHVVLIPAIAACPWPALRGVARVQPPQCPHESRDGVGLPFGL